MFNFEIKPTCEKGIKKHCRKNPVLKTALERKMSEIVQNPYHYKPLKYDLAGECRVHIMKSFVLRFLIEEKTSTVIFLFFGHHDEAYER